MKKALYTYILLVTLKCVNAQELKDKVKQLSQKVEEKFTGDTTAEPNFLMYPTIAYTPETRWEIGLVNLLLFYANKDKTNRLSELNAFTFLTQKGQYGIWIDHAVYGEKDRYFLLGNARFQYFPLKYYGIGNNAPSENYSIVEARSIQIRERVLTKINGNLFGGVQFDYQHLGNVNFINNTDNLPKQGSILGMNGSNSNGLGLALVFDERKNVLNERKSRFAEAGFVHYDKVIGSSFSFTKVFIDGRWFTNGFGKNQVFAAQAISQLTFGNAPFNMLSLAGGESMMRGYYLGRYRDNHLIATQAEYRFLPFSFSKRIGAAAFLALGSVQPEIKQFNFKEIKPTGGAGLRYLIFSSKDIFIRFDVAVNKESSGYYLYIGEAF
ncbi:MAG: hypothetical protein ACK4K9_04045 [Bacteroidia bacterium]